MTLAELQALLETTGLPVAYRCFTEEEVKLKSIVPPFICWINDYDDNFGADNSVYQKNHRIRIELYEDFRDETTEGKVENALAEIYFTKDIEYIDSEKLFQVNYQLSI